MRWDAREHETQQQNYPRLVYPLTSRRCRRFVFFAVYTRPIYWHTRARLNTRGLNSPKRKKNTEICFLCREEAKPEAGFDNLWVYHDKVGIGTESNVCVPPSPYLHAPLRSLSLFLRGCGTESPEWAGEKTLRQKKKQGSQCISKPRRRRRSFKLNFCLAAEGSGGGITLRVSRGRVRLRRALFTLKGHRGWGVITRQHYYLFLYFFHPCTPRRDQSACQIFRRAAFSYSFHGTFDLGPLFPQPSVLSLLCRCAFYFEGGFRTRPRPFGILQRRRHLYPPTYSR